MLNIYAVVGERALPVILPIINLLDGENQPSQVALIHTDKTKKIADLAQNYLKNKYTNDFLCTQITTNEFLEQLKNNQLNLQNSYFNLTPGLNWFISKVTLHLSGAETILYADNQYLYFFSAKDFSQKNKLDLINIGLDDYLILNPAIKIKPTKSKKRTINLGESYNILDVVDKNNKSILDERKRILNCINLTFITLKEHRGFLYLYFDLRKRSISDDLLKQLNVKNNNKQYAILKLYRILLGVFEPLNYRLIVLSDWKKLIDRGKYDDVYVVEKEIDFKKLYQKPPLPHKHKIKEDKSQLSPPLRLKQGKVKKGLFVCLGVNLEPTLKAIKSHAADKVVVFHDTSPKILNYTKKLLAIERKYNCKFETIETNHRGNNVVPILVKKVKNENIQWSINITPGTKAQSIALSVGAKCAGIKKNIYSLKARNLENILTQKQGNEIPIIKPEELLYFYLDGEHRDKVQNINSDLEKLSPLWGQILTGLAENRVQYKSNGFIGLIQNNPNLNVRIDLENQKIYYQDVDQNVSNDFFDYLCNKENPEYDGRWWELLTYWAVLQANLAPPEQVRLNLEIGKEKNPFTEFDVVLPFETNVIIISCKVGKQYLMFEDFALRSETRSRFGRMALCFLATNVLDVKDDQFIPEVGLLTPKQLSNPEILAQTIKKHRDRLKTTT
ncbi:MAG: hypothetical protein Q9M37_02630 [Desulfonauticus sp.]|nr:hypothetical protein [Desulfonauticus sp.]